MRIALLALLAVQALALPTRAAESLLRPAVEARTAALEAAREAAQLDPDTADLMRKSLASAKLRLDEGDTLLAREAYGEARAAFDDAARLFGKAVAGRQLRDRLVESRRALLPLKAAAQTAADAARLRAARVLETNADGYLLAGEIEPALADLARARTAYEALLTPEALAMLRSADQAARNRQTRRIDLGDGVELELILVQPGSFMMGSPADEVGRAADEVLHKVTLTKAFYLGRTEVTQAQWKAVMGTNPSNFKGDDLPVDSVSWTDAQQFCAKLSAKDGRRFRLPTEAEWEYACRAGSPAPYSGTGRLEDMGWFRANTDQRTSPVGQKLPNAWGFHDMHGNLWEWCADIYDELSAADATDPTGAAGGVYRVLRGGSWMSLPADCRSAERNRELPDFRRQAKTGFRLALDAQ
jgi:formylglycine-generating enzyme required for sulfatase activity